VKDLLQTFLCVVGSIPGQTVDPKARRSGRRAGPPHRRTGSQRPQAIALVSKHSKSLFIQISNRASYPILNTHAYESIVVCHDNRRHVLLPIVEPIATTMNPYQDGQIFSVGGCIDIQEETIFVAEDEVVSWYRVEALWANRSVGHRRLHRGTVQVWPLGRLPAEQPSWGCCEADTVNKLIQKHVHTLNHD
jgi:hypothetical protein